MKNSYINIPEYWYVIEMLSLEKIAPLWPFLNLPVPYSSEIQNVFMGGVKKIIEYKHRSDWAEDVKNSADQYAIFFNNTIEDIFKELDTFIIHDSSAGKAIQNWIELDFLSILESAKSEPWKGLWKVLFFRLGKYKDGRPTFLDSQRGQKFFEIAEMYYMKKEEEDKELSQIDMVPWIGWDKIVYDQYYSFVDDPTDVDLEASFGSPLQDLSTYLEVKNFVMTLPKVVELLTQKELQKLNAWGMDEAQTMGYSSMIEKDKASFLKEYSILDLKF